MSDESDLGIYVLDNEGEHHRIAECPDDNLAFTLRMLTQEKQITCASEVGNFDLHERTWLIVPWPASPFGTRRMA